jgi:hypothetical protein
MNTQPSDMTKSFAPRALGLYAIPVKGELPGSRIVELFAHAASERFNGSLTIEPKHGARIVFRIQRGNITRWQSLDDQTFILESLGESLPPEQVDLVRRHAYESNLDEFGAAARLGLLSLKAIEWIHRGATARLVRALSEPRRHFQYSFQAGLDCFEGQDGFSQSISALWLLCESLSHGEVLPWCREKLMSLADSPIRMTPMGRSLGPALFGKPRQIVLRLSANPESLEGLREVWGTLDAALVGTIYALLATGGAELVADSGIVPRSSEGPPSEARPSSAPSGARFKVLREGEWISPGSYRSGALKDADPITARARYETPLAPSSEIAPASRAVSSRTVPTRMPSSPPPSTSIPSTRVPSTGVRTGSTFSHRSTDGPVPDNGGSDGRTLDGRDTDVRRSVRHDTSGRPSDGRTSEVRSGVNPPSGVGPVVRRGSPSELEPSERPTVRPPNVQVSSSTERSPAPSERPRPSEAVLENAALDMWSRALGGDRAVLLQAEAHVEKMANLFPKNPSILYYLGALYHLTGKTFEAETTLLRVIDLDSENIGAREELIRVRRTIDSERRTPNSLLKKLLGKGV